MALLRSILFNYSRVSYSSRYFSSMTDKVSYTARCSFHELIVSWRWGHNFYNI